MAEKYTTVSNFRRRQTHDPVSTPELLLAAQKRFCCLNGRGPLKKLKFGGNIEYLRVYRLISLTRPLTAHFTVPLNIRHKKK
jgi:hypothetical protein